MFYLSKQDVRFSGGNDSASLLSCSLLYLHSSLLPFSRVDSIFLKGTSPLVRPSAVKEAVFDREPSVVLCQFTPRMPVKHSLIGDTSSYRRPHWGQTRQKIHSSLRWPLDVLFWHDMQLGGVWGVEDTVRGLEDLYHKMDWQADKAKAVILNLHPDCVDVIYRDWSHSCLQALGLWSPWSRPPLYGSVEHNIKHCCWGVWKMSSSIKTITHMSKKGCISILKHWVQCVSALMRSCRWY